jgi:hypothetical protein
MNTKIAVPTQARNPATQRNFIYLEAFLPSTRSSCSVRFSAGSSFPAVELTLSFTTDRPGLFCYQLQASDNSSKMTSSLADHPGHAGPAG